MASPAGFEPTTTCLEGRCSIQLSYEDVNQPRCYWGFRPEIAALFSTGVIPLEWTLSLVSPEAQILSVESVIPSEAHLRAGRAIRSSARSEGWSGW
jgi:hypothetical protein